MRGTRANSAPGPLLRLRSAAPSRSCPRCHVCPAAHPRSDSVWKGTASRGAFDSPTGRGIQQLLGEARERLGIRRKTRQDRAEMSQVRRTLPPSRRAEKAAGGHSAASRGMDTPSFDSLPPEKQVGQTPVVFWGHLGRADEGGCRNTATRRWAARLRAANRCAPFRQVMPACSDISLIKTRAWGRCARTKLH